MLSNKRIHVFLMKAVGSSVGKADKRAVHQIRNIPALRFLLPYIKEAPEYDHQATYHSIYGGVKLPEDTLKWIKHLRTFDSVFELADTGMTEKFIIL